MKINNKWTENEVIFLKENYKNKGCKYVAINLNRTENSVKGMARRLNIKSDYEIFCNEETLRNVVSESISYKDVCDKLNKTKGGATYKIIKRLIKKYNIDISHFNPFSRDTKNTGFTIEYWLVEGSNISSNGLKQKLYNNGLKERVCELCNQNEEWNGKKMALILDHINGVNNDNRIENLRIVCPNCNATLETHCRGHKGIK